MKKICPKCISLLFAGILFSAALGLSLCLHNNGQWHFTPSKTQDCFANTDNKEFYSPVGHDCIDLGFELDADLALSKNPIKLVLLSAIHHTFEVKVPAEPVAKPEVFCLKNAPPEIVLGELYNNIVARLLI